MAHVAAGAPAVASDASAARSRRPGDGLRDRKLLGWRGVVASGSSRSWRGGVRVMVGARGMYRIENSFFLDGHGGAKE